MTGKRPGTSGRAARALALLVATLPACAAVARAQTGAEPSVLVRTTKPVKGSLPDVVVAYGTAGPALNGSMTLSLQSQGRIADFLVTAGEAVSAGQPLIHFSVSQAALGSYRQAQIALSTARIEHARLQQLRGQQLATKDQVTLADKAIADAQSQLDTLARSGSDATDVIVKAPFDGVVTSIPVAQGDTLAPGAPMMTLMRADGLVVIAGIEPSMLDRVRRGDAATISPLSGGREVVGEVARIDGQLNPKTRLVDTDIATRARLLPGAAFRAAIVVGRLEGYVVPRDAVVQDGGTSACFQVSGGKAKRVAVDVLGGTDEESVVSGAIDPGLPLVVYGNHQLADGSAVRLSDREAGAP